MSTISQINVPCQTCIYARRAAAESLRKDGWTACWLPLLFQAGKSDTPLVKQEYRNADQHDLSVFFAEKMDLEGAATGWAHNVRPDSERKESSMYNHILLVKGLKGCPFKENNN